MENQTDLSSSPIEEIWLIRDGICIFHEYWTSQPLNLNIQLFSAFTMAVSSFSKNTLPSGEQLRNIDFQNTTLVLEPLAEFSILFVVKFSSISSEKQVEIMNFILQDIKVFINYEVSELFTLDGSAIPLNAYTKPLTNFFHNFIVNFSQNEKTIRKVDLLSILDLSENLYTIIIKSRPDLSKTDIDSLNLENIFNSLIFSTGLSTDSLPTLSRRELKTQFQEFVNCLKDIIRINRMDKHLLQHNLTDFFITHYKLIKSYDLDEPFVLNLLTVFHEH